MVCPGPKYFEFIVSDEDVMMETDINDFNGKMKVLKSENNKIFYDYIRFLGSMKEKASNLKQDDVNEREELDLMVKNFQNDHIFKNLDFLAAKVLAMSIDPTIPKEIQNDPKMIQT